jgi:ribosomal protein S19
MKREPITENDVKDIVRQWCDKHNAHHFAVVQNGMGVHGIHDRLMALPITVTPEMVGKKVGLFVSLECKKPGRRGEPDRGMSKHQVLFMEGVKKAGGVSFCVDGHEDLLELQAALQQLAGGSNG